MIDIRPPVALRTAPLALQDIPLLRLPQARLDQVLDRFHEVGARMGAATDGAEVGRLSKEYAELKPVADAVEGLARLRAEMADLEAMTADPEMAAMAQEELRAPNDSWPLYTSHAADHLYRVDFGCAARYAYNNKKQLSTSIDGS